MYMWTVYRRDKYHFFKENYRVHLHTLAELYQSTNTNLSTYKDIKALRVRIYVARVEVIGVVIGIIEICEPVPLSHADMRKIKLWYVTIRPGYKAITILPD